MKMEVSKKFDQPLQIMKLLSKYGYSTLKCQGNNDFLNTSNSVFTLQVSFCKMCVKNCVEKRNNSNNNKKKIHFICGETGD